MYKLFHAQGFMLKGGISANPPHASFQAVAQPIKGEQMIVPYIFLLPQRGYYPLAQGCDEVATLGKT